MNLFLRTILIATILGWNNFAVAALNDGLIAHYKLDGDTNDSVGEYHGIAENPYESDNLTYLPGKIKQAGHFYEIEYIEISNFQTPSHITVSGWLRTSAPWEAGDIFSKHSMLSGNYGLYFSVHPNKNIVAAISTNGRSLTSVQGTSQVDDGLWHSAVFTYDGNKIKLYVDGELEDTKTLSGNLTNYSYDALIGARDPNSVNHESYFHGELDDIRIYNRALSAIEVAELFNMDKDTFVPCTNEFQNAVCIGENDFSSGLCKIIVYDSKTNSPGGKKKECTGFLINDDHVLTAHNCFDEINEGNTWSREQIAENSRCLFGHEYESCDSVLAETIYSELQSIKEIVVEGSSGNNLSDKDYSLVRLTRPVQFQKPYKLSSTINLGDQVKAYGFPDNAPAKNVACGHITDLNPEMTNTNYFQYDINATHGASGGPVIDRNGYYL